MNARLSHRSGRSGLLVALVITLGVIHPPHMGLLRSRPQGCLTSRLAPPFSRPPQCLPALPASTSGAAGPGAVTEGTDLLPIGAITTTAGGALGSGRPTTYGVQPSRVALDGRGVLLIADNLNGVIWLENLTAHSVVRYGRTVAAGAIARIAGVAVALGGYSGDGGPATMAELNSPAGLAVDGAGNLYIADAGNNRIREVVASSGVITTVAGSGTPGYGGDGGPATAAQLNAPAGVALDAAGNLFIADGGNNRIREVLAATGAITTVAGDGSPGCTQYGGPCFGGDGGPATAAKLRGPQDVAIDGTGNLLIADTVNYRIREVFASTGIITTVAGSGGCCYGGDAGPATQAWLNLPSSLALDSHGDYYIADTNNNRIREVLASSGLITTVAGTGLPYPYGGGYGGDGGPATQALLNLPTGVVVDHRGTIFIADSANVRVRRVAASSGIITTIAGSGSVGCRSAHDRLICVGGDGGRATGAELGSPYDMVVDPKGNLYIADTYNDRIREVLAGSGVITTVVGTGTTGFSGDGGPATQADLNYPEGLATDSAGNLFIADLANGRVRELVASSGIITTVAGTGGCCYSGDGGPATQAELSAPAGVAVDDHGNLFIADSANSRIREVFAATGIITTVAGTGRVGSGGDGGPATQAQITTPTGVALDRKGDLFIADFFGLRIREVLASSQVITTVAGNGTQGSSGDGGPATQAALDLPNSVAVDGVGNVFIADTFNNRIREVLASSGLITTVVGTGAGSYGGDGGAATAAALNQPYGVAVGKEGLYIADTNNNRVRLVRYH